MVDWRNYGNTIDPSESYSQTLSALFSKGEENKTEIDSYSKSTGEYYSKQIDNG